VETVTVSRTFEGDLAAMVELCRSLDSRQHWPGAQIMGAREEMLSYQVSMRLKAATMTDIDIAERVSPVESAAGGGCAFHTSQKCVWPDGVAEGETDYVFTPGTPNTLTFTYKYEPPSTRLVRSKQLPAFREGMVKVANRYLDGLVGAAVLA
jgi:hypothetical protein